MRTRRSGRTQRGAGRVRCCLSVSTMEPKEAFPSTEGMRGVGDALRASPAPVSLSSRCPERSFQIKAEREGGGFAWDTAPPRPCEPGDPIRAGLRCSSYTRTVLTARPQGPPVPRGSHGRGCFSSSEGPSRKPEVQSGHRCFCRGLNACLAVCCLRGRTMFPVIITV